MIDLLKFSDFNEFMKRHKVLRVYYVLLTYKEKREYKKYIYKLNYKEYILDVLWEFFNEPVMAVDYAWEANVARYYNYLGIEWQFEPKTFIFENIKRGSVSYTPDFYLPKEDKWVEVKGWMDGKSKTKLKRFKEQYPDEYAKLQLITEKEYKEIQRKLACFIKNWEY